MKRNYRLLAVALMAATALLLGTNIASAAGKQGSFKANFAGTASFDPGTNTATFVGGGVATRMGRIATQGHADITGPDNSCTDGIANINTETLTDSDGETLTITSQDVACPTNPEHTKYHGTGHWTVTGGTGRFDGATGQGSLDGSLDFGAGTFTVTLTGTLVLLDT
jgi:hypothetical protein